MPKGVPVRIRARAYPQIRSATVAQLVELSIRNRAVVGSSPTGGSKLHPLPRSIEGLASNLPSDIWIPQSSAILHRSRGASNLLEISGSDPLARQHAALRFRLGGKAKPQVVGQETGRRTPPAAGAADCRTPGHSRPCDGGAAPGRAAQRGRPPKRPRPPATRQPAAGAVARDHLRRLHNVRLAFPTIRSFGTKPINLLSGHPSISLVSESSSTESRGTTHGPQS